MTATGKSAPAISLLIPCFNAAPYLPKLYASIKSQQKLLHEVIAYDDGSTDETLAVAADLGLRCLPGGANRGVAVARNRLATAATGSWIHFCDADDPLHPDYIPSVIAACEDRVDVITCNADWVTPTGQPVLQWRYDGTEISTSGAAYLLSHPMSLTNSLIRRTTWLSVGGCDESLRMWEDGDVHFRMALAGATFRHLPHVLSISIRRADSLSHDYAQNWRWRLACLEKYAAAGIPRHLKSAWLEELNKTATALLNLGKTNETNKALQLARLHGSRLPVTKNGVLKCLRPFLSDLAMLRLQNRVRNRIS